MTYYFQSEQGHLEAKQNTTKGAFVLQEVRDGQFICITNNRKVALQIWWSRNDQSGEGSCVWWMELVYWLQSDGRGLILEKRATK